MLRHTLFIALFSALFVLNGCGGGSTSAASNKESTLASQTSEAEKITDTTITQSSNKALKTIDLLVLVDKNDKNNFNGINETKIDHFIAVTNKIYKNSGLDVAFNIKKIQAYEFTSTTSSDSLHEVHDDKNIKDIRNQVKADLVITYRKHANDGICGVAYTNISLDKNTSFAHVALECDSMTTAHELGHSMGLTHTERSAKNAGLFDYAHGYILEGEFITIMAYETKNTHNRMFNYSSPDLDCRGYECGIDSELEHGVDAVKALKYATTVVAEFN